jgi:predicted hotdog family 3-hydroxylacyl-ACP dehydratase
MDDDLHFPISAELLVPHKPPFRFIDKLLETSKYSAVAESIVSSENILVDDDGGLDPLIMVEMMAQTFAAFQGYHELSNGLNVKRGFLVDVRKLQILDRCFRGDCLLIKLNRTGTFGGFDIANGEVICNDKVIASGTIKVWIAE